MVTKSVQIVTVVRLVEGVDNNPQI
ncbi:uncharacterized protein METZ01_LOCUS72775 [marine metagenome]|uniref:Uncharacterized protein n=1 Tax=marine metagenome TaxID=408172 RepID=A0A381TWT7_9ZZZZ